MTLNTMPIDPKDLEKVLKTLENIDNLLERGLEELSYEEVAGDQYTP